MTSPSASASTPAQPGTVTGKGKDAYISLDGKKVTCKELIGGGKTDCIKPVQDLFAKYAGGTEAFLQDFRKTVAADTGLDAATKKYAAGLSNFQLAFVGFTTCDLKAKGASKKDYVASFRKNPATAKEFKPLLEQVWQSSVDNLCRQ